MKNTKADKQNKDGNIVNILGVGVVSSSINILLRRIIQECEKKDITKPFFVVTANPEIIMMAQKDEKYRDLLNRAGLVLADGVGLKLAGIKEVIPGRVLVEQLLGIKIKVFFLGGRNGVAREMAGKYGGEWDEGEKSIRAGERENIRILDKINKYKPDVLLVAYGAPWQEKWIAANLDKIRAKVVMGVGGTFDYLTGRKPMPPDWISRVGLEWLWRLTHEPWRWRRQLSLFRFIWRILVLDA